MLEQVQQAYEEMRAYFTRPGAVLAQTTSGCQYRTWDNRACAIGCRIPDEWIKARGRNRVNECGGIEGLYDAFPEIEQFIGRADSELYSFHADAQMHHDRSSDVTGFVASLDDLARMSGLQLVTESAPVEDRPLVTA